MNTYSGVSPAALEVVWHRVLPGAKLTAGELCLQGADGHIMPTGSLIRVEL